MPVQEMLGRMSSEEITEWKAFFIYKSEKQKPKPQTPDQARAVFMDINARATTLKPRRK